MNRLSNHLAISVLIVIILSGAETASGKGTLLDTSFFSISLNETRSMDIYLPEKYSGDESINYPVVYYLHGYGQSQHDYPFITDSLDVMIADNKIGPVILVKPDASAHPFQDWNPKSSWYANSELTGYFEDYIVYDLVSYIDNQYRTMATPEKRSIMGFSMGGNGAMHLALKHPDIFGAVASLSGTLDFSWCDDILITYAKKLDYNNTPPFDLSPNKGFASLELFSRSAAYSPNLHNPPYFVDCVIDSMGNMVDSVWAKWMLFDPITLVSGLPVESNLQLYFDSGKNDELGMFTYNTNFAGRLASLGRNYVFYQYDGKHADLLNTRIPKSLVFLDSVMQEGSATLVNQHEPDHAFFVPESIILYQNFPNPFNPSTIIEFSLPRSETVTLTVYNLMGQDVATLVSGQLSQGPHRVTWDASGLSTGVYICQMRTESMIQTKKLTFMQ
jgi:S-formylglutathione hydrolase FrmB